MHTMTARIGFEVMGIWDADAGFEDVNSTCASRRGFPKLDLNRYELACLIHHLDPPIAFLFTMLDPFPFLSLPPFPSG